ncbi:MAG: hypothetical protein Q4C42_09430 [Clostridia bacterium]|nr:hypothetical protein [Clostridia bacterium]
MPRKPKFTKEEVIMSAFEVTEKTGLNSVTAASVASNMGYTGSSLFTHFNNMVEIRFEAYLKAKEYAMNFVSDCKNYRPVFKAFGLLWVEFAREKPNLFRAIYAGNPYNTAESNIFEENKETFEPMYYEIMQSFDVSREAAIEIFTECIYHANGIADFMITNPNAISQEQISRSLSRICLGSVMLHKAKEGTLTPELAKAYANAVDAIPVRISAE